MQPTDIKPIFCASLLKLRKARGCTQAEVAAALHISDKTYSKWECGENNPSLTDIAALADYFGVPADTLLRSPEEEAPSPLEGLSPAEAIRKTFLLEFAAVRDLARRAVRNSREYDLPAVPPPEENPVNPGRDHAITAYACDGTCFMLYSGTDANLGLTLFPAQEQMRWLQSQRDALAAYLALLGEPDFLQLLPALLTLPRGERFDARHAAQLSGLSDERCETLLLRAAGEGICSRSETHLGAETVSLYRFEADQMLCGILTLAHLSLPDAEKNGCWYFNTPARQIMVEGSVS